MRNQALGFVYQFHHLLPEFTAAENVAMPLLIRGASPARALVEAEQFLMNFALGERVTHRPAELSGGERQRVAIARALITRPVAVLADEPTGNLDRATGERVFDLLLRSNTEFATALIVVTHDPAIASRMDRILELQDGGLRERPAAPR